MITTPLLEEKYRVQRELAEESDHDVGKYIENVRRIAAEAALESKAKPKLPSSNTVQFAAQKRS